jgi:glucokinase
MGAPAEACADALREIGAERGAAVAVASPVPDAPFVADAIAAISHDFSPLPVVSAGVAAIVAESWIGAARGIADVAFLAARDHVAAGILRAGVPVLGAHGRAANVAWMSLNPVDREDYRRTGGMAAEVGAHGIVRRLIWRIKSGDHSNVQEAAGGDLSAITLEHVLDGARAGDGVAISVVRDTAKYLAMAAANLVTVVDPEMLVLGGIMSTAPDLLDEPVRTELARRLPKAIVDHLAVAAAALGESAAAVGAARLSAAVR